MAVTPGPSPSSPLPDLQRRGQDLVAGLAAFHQAIAQELTNRQQELASRQQELQAQQASHEADVKQLQARLAALHADHEALKKRYAVETKALQDRLTALTADNEGLQADQLQWAMEREEHLKARQLADVRHAELDQTLQSTREEHETLKALHGQVTEQAQKLAADWNTRRQALAGENQALHNDLDQARNSIQLLQQREKQWQAQVFKLQDELRGLRETAGRMSITDEQSHHLLSQLNSIIGFAEVLLDEAGNRATSEDREEFLRDIKESGTHLADYIHQLQPARTDEAAASDPEPAAAPAAKPWVARTILVATTDAAVAERTQAFLNKADYQVEFATDPDEAVRISVEQQPLAIVIDSELPDAGAQKLTEALQREARTRDIPVVLTVSNAGQPPALTIDRFDLLTKPLNRQQMLQLMIKYDLLADRRHATKMPTSVLVIDDDPRNTRLVKAILKPYAMNVLEASGGAAGIKLALTSKPDLIILDLMMPDVDGFQVVSALRNDPATSQIPILIYTAKTVTGEDRARLKHDIQAIVRKGELSKEEFLDMVYKRGERRNRPPTEDAA